VSGHTTMISEGQRTDGHEEAWGELLGREMRELLNVILLTLILFFAIRSIVLNFRVTGSSMEPTFHDGEYVFVYRLAYWRHPPRRGDVIVFRYPPNPKRTLIKRVIGLPGETVSVHNGQVYINGLPLPEPYIAASPTYVADPVVVGPHQVYVLGDNRNFSNDSHSWGLLDMNMLVGKVVWRYWPLTRMGPIPHATYPPPLDRPNPHAEPSSETPERHGMMPSSPISPVKAPVEKGGP